LISEVKLLAGFLTDGGVKWADDIQLPVVKQRRMEAEQLCFSLALNTRARGCRYLITLIGGVQSLGYITTPVVNLQKEPTSIFFKARQTSVPDIRHEHGNITGFGCKRRYTAAVPGQLDVVTLGCRWNLA
jgi:hypothetical protein